MSSWLARSLVLLVTLSALGCGDDGYGPAPESYPVFQWCANTVGHPVPATAEQAQGEFDFAMGTADELAVRIELCLQGRQPCDDPAWLTAKRYDMDFHAPCSGGGSPECSLWVVDGIVQGHHYYCWN